MERGGIRMVPHCLLAGFFGALRIALSGGKASMAQYPARSRTGSYGYEWPVKSQIISAIDLSIIHGA